MKKRLNLLCACVLIGLLLSTSTVISLMVQAVSAGFKAGYESVEKGKELNISDYKIVCTIPSDLFAETGSVTNLKNSSQASPQAGCVTDTSIHLFFYHHHDREL